MDYETLEKTVSERAGMSRSHARTLIRATLDTLSERLTRGEANDLAAQLPEPAKEWLVSSEPEAEKFGLEEFVRRVSRRAAVPPEEAERAVSAVFSTLREAVTAGEFRDVLSQLPSEFSTLVKS
jgi:uncharacterized protein (DUF2267 family)